MSIVRTIFAALLLGLCATNSATAEIYGFLVPSRVIYAGERLNPADFIEKKFQIAPAAAKNYVLVAAQLNEMEATRVLPVGRPIAVSSIRRSAAVRKGQQVDAEYNHSGIRIEARLVALEDGEEGSEIAARNPASGKSVRARVKKDGSLEVLQ
ncbi:MAG: flagellar basal body P-ring formation chaperone FlgA [Aestuariivirga sp.]